MAWTLYFLVGITAFQMTVSAYKCKHTSYASSLPQHDYANQEPIRIPDNRAYQHMGTRSADISPAVYSPNVRHDMISAQIRLGENSDSSKIVFPGPTSEEFQLQIPEHCKRLGICEDVPNYPTEQVKKVLSELPDLDMFSDDKPDLPDVPDIAQRVGPQEENIELCQFEERLMYPKAAIDANGNWHVVLQADNPMQGFKVEICKQDSPPCSGVAVFVNGYEGRCKQKFVYRKMSVLQNGTRLERSLKVPSCCSCVARLVLS